MAFIPLGKGPTQVVFGAGHPNADLMFIGDEITEVIPRGYVLS